MRRTRLRPVSDKRRAEWTEQAKIRAEVFEHDEYRCQAATFNGCCWGPLTYHHLKKASAGGKFTVDNGLTLCQFHNGAVEDHPIEARKLGLVR